MYFIWPNGLLGASIETDGKICCSNIKLFLIIYLDAIIFFEETERRFGTI